ncbi:MAG: hypothetical protein ACRYGG_11880 [Janthinobacterium lividum]
MTYPGDTYNFILTIKTDTGAMPNVTSSPVITIVSLSTNLPIVSSQPMMSLNGTQNQVYTYAWNTSSLANGDYLGLVSYAYDAVTVNSQLLEKVKLGDSRVIGIVALDSTVAKDATVSKDSTVAHASDLLAISPNNSSLVQAIKAKTDNLPSDPASTSNLNVIQASINILVNAALGSWAVNKASTPNVLTFYNTDNSVLATFTLSDSSVSSNRTRLT